MALWVLIASALFGFVVAVHEPVCLDAIEAYNLETLETSIKSGYHSFCNCEIDEGVLTMYPGTDLSDVTVEWCSWNGTTVIPISEICDQCKLLELKKHVLVHVNGYISKEHDTKEPIREIVKCRKDMTVLIIDFATSLPHLYATSKLNPELHAPAYAVLKVIDALILNGIHHKNIVLSGHSQGAHIASLAARMFEKSRHHKAKLPLLVLLDPAIPCLKENNQIHTDACDRVLVIHGNNKDLSIKEPVGGIDFYPNGDEGTQPGCKTQDCTHVFPIWVFREAVCHPHNILGICCNSWSEFVKDKCNKHDILGINLDIPGGVDRSYYACTRDKSPLGLGHEGLKLGHHGGKWENKWEDKWEEPKHPKMNAYRPSYGKW